MEGNGVCKRTREVGRNGEVRKERQREGVEDVRRSAGVKH